MINGWINVNKPKGINSTKVVGIIKRVIRELTGVKKFKIGHGGTLDPLASGILPIAIGEATKTVDYIMHNRKKYNFTIVFGENRDTIDAEGVVTKTSTYTPNKEEIIKVLEKFKGKIKQAPPAYSAIKINGKRAYDLAREGKLSDKDMTMRDVEIFTLNFIGFIENSDNKEVELSAECGKGFYVRSLARDICEELDVCGYVNKLDRVRVGDFYKKDSISLAKLEKIDKLNELENIAIPVQEILSGLPTIELNEFQSKIAKNGGAIHLYREGIINVKVNDDIEDVKNDTFMVLDFTGKMIALGAIVEDKIKIVRGFNL